MHITTGYLSTAFQAIIRLSLAALILTACTGSNIDIPPTDPPVTVVVPEAVATALPPLGTAGSTIIANALNPTPDNEAIINTVDVLISESLPVQVNAVVKGKLPDGCVKIERISQERSGNTLVATIITNRQPDADCIAQLQSFEQVLPLDVSGLPPGAYTVTVKGANSVSTTFQVGGASPLPASATPPPVPTFTPVPVPVVANASISGIVWADFCRSLASGAPSAGCIPDGRGGYRADGTYTPGEARIAGVQVTLRPGSCPGNGSTLTATTDGTGLYHFDGLQPGPYCVAIDASLPVFPPGDWTFPAPGVGQVAVVVEASQNKIADFGWDDQLDRVVPASGAVCVDQATYVTDVTIPDNTLLAPGASFVKIWRIRNIGSCAWDANYSLVFVGGEAMGGQAPVSLSQAVQPGSEVDLSISLVAPPVPGVYRGEWELQNGRRATFGSQGDYPFYVQIVIGGPSTPAPPQALSISGRVWEDFCQVLENGSFSGGCVLDGASGDYRADGLFNNDERGLAGVQVKLSVGVCPGNNFVFTPTTTDANGAYHFNDLQPGPHCISIDALTEPNASLLLPGAWTYPAPGLNSVTVIAGENQSQTANFAWDYEQR